MDDKEMLEFLRLLETILNSKRKSAIRDVKLLLMLRIYKLTLRLETKDA